jgi:hypothetical protein
MLIGGVGVAASSAEAAVPAGSGPASGTITCDSVTGTIKFSPRLTDTAQTVTEKESLKISGCTVTSGVNSGIVYVANVINSSRSNVKNNDATCPVVFGGTNGILSWPIVWKNPAATPSTLTFPPGDVTLASNDEGLTFGGGKGTVSVTGSYAGSKGSMELQSNTNILTPCAGKKGLKSIKIVGGTLSL